MGRFMVVAKADRLEEYTEIARKYNVSFEINDFYEARILDDIQEQNRIIRMYHNAGIPEGSTMHGAFLDIVLFSSDEKICEISKLRMKQSMEIARRLRVRGVVFHTNCNPMLSGETYDYMVVSKTVAYVEKLLEQYPEIDIYMENMFDISPRVLVQISEKLVHYPNYGVCLDYAHASISDVPMSDWVEQLAPYIKHVHINDNDLKRDLHWAVGTGQIDWNQFAKYYRTHFDQCSILVETTLPELQVQSLQYLKENFVSLF